MKKLLLSLIAVLAMTFMANAWVTYDFEDGTMQGWTTIDADGDGECWTLKYPGEGEFMGHNNSLGYMYSASYVNYAGALTPDNYLVCPTKGYYAEIIFYACAQDPTHPAEHFGVAVSTAGNTSASDFTTIQEWTMTAKGQGKWYEYSIELNEYAGQEIWVAIRHFDCTNNFRLNVDDIRLKDVPPPTVIDEIYIEGYTAPELNQHPDYDINVKAGEPYSIDEVIWLCNGNTMNSTAVFEFGKTYCMVISLIPDKGYAFDKHAIVYYDNDSSVHCLGDNVLNEEGVLWVVTIAYVIRDPDKYDFEDGTMQDWTTIDADGDGYCWDLKYPGESGYLGHNSSLGFMFSESYKNEVGALTPDNYLVCPTKGNYAEIKFYACAQNAIYSAEHFGVAVSTGSNTDASDFTTIQEWTMTAKQGNWYEYSVDLSAYADQDIWVAIRHFNCTDQYRLNVDDITLTEGALPTIIDEIYLEGYTAPKLAQHPDYDINVKAGEPYSIGGIKWMGPDGQMNPDDIFEVGNTYCMSILLTPDEGYAFDENAIVYYDGDNSVHNIEKNWLYEDGNLAVYTIEYFISGEGVTESNANLFSMYPNPTKDNVMIESEVSVNQYDIYDITGALVMSNKVNTATFTVNVGALPAGSYIIRLTSDGMIQNRGFIKE